MAIAIATTRASLASTYVGLGTWLSLHTSSPGTTGANEATGGSPAYARKQTTWGATTGGTSTGTEVVIDAAAGTYTHVCLWAASSGGAAPIDVCDITDVVLNAQGQVRVTPTVTIT